nr:TetR/AcrR family transcriptional regulator [Gluconacetobacter tumulisoli]
MDAAQASLLESGVDAVRIQQLARRLNLSRTSFYWFFTDRAHMLDALLERWRIRNSGGIVARTTAYAETVAEAVLNLFDCWLDPALFDSQFEFAVRSWALQSADVAAAVGAADNMRLAAIAAMLRRFDIAPGTADVRARAIYLTQIGYISARTTEDQAERMGRIADYVDVFSGIAPTGMELARFYARHRFQPPDSAPAAPRRVRRRTVRSG